MSEPAISESCPGRMRGAKTERDETERNQQKRRRALMTGAFAVGDWIGGRFQVFDIHEGGMSLVYVVNDHVGSTGPKVVALKTLREELLRSRIRVSRFAAECRLWVQLGEHPNVVHAYSVEIIERPALRRTRADSRG